jgi:hypothetical protein
MLILLGCGGMGFNAMGGFLDEEFVSPCPPAGICCGALVDFSLSPSLFSS